MFRFTIRDLLWLTVLVALSVGWWLDRRTHVTATTLGKALTLEHAQSFHLRIQEALPAEVTLEPRGFPKKKWTKGLEPHDRYPKALGTWTALDYSDKLRPIPMLGITLVLNPNDEDAKWDRFGVRIEVFNEPNPKATASRLALLNELRK